MVRETTEVPTTMAMAGITTTAMALMVASPTTTAYTAVSALENSMALVN